MRTGTEAGCSALEGQPRSSKKGQKADDILDPAGRLDGALPIQNKKATKLCTLEQFEKNMKSLRANLPILRKCLFQSSIIRPRKHAAILPARAIIWMTSH